MLVESAKYTNWYGCMKSCATHNVKMVMIHLWIDIKKKEINAINIQLINVCSFQNILWKWNSPIRLIPNSERPWTMPCVRLWGRSLLSCSERSKSLQSKVSRSSVRAQLDASLVTDVIVPGKPHINIYIQANGLHWNSKTLIPCEVLIFKMIYEAVNWYILKFI